MGILLSAKQISKSFGDRPLLESISFVVSSNERIGLIGPNGAGKSTLLKILSGAETVDEGEITSPRSLKLRTLAQVPQFDEDKTIGEGLSEGLEGLDSWSRDQKVVEALWRYGLESKVLDPQRKIKELSGGWKKRLAILRELLHEPDLLLMDEPTNHLDVEGILWLEEVIRASPFAHITVTHDRYFLDKVANRIFELDRRNENGLLSVDGNYTRYLEVKSALMQAQESREASLRGVLRRESEWLKAGVKARTTKQQARIHRHSELSSEVAELSRRNQKQNVRMQFHVAGEQPKRLLESKAISKSYGDLQLFKNLDLLLIPGSCIGILGENGCGKSSLIRVLLGEEKPDKGSIFRSDFLKVAYFEQGKDQVDPEQSLIQSLCPKGDHVLYRGRHIHIRSYLERFLFEQEKMDLPAGYFSGGEQSRILLARLMLIEANLLVLDEPTNDLDIPTLNVLEDCLKEFDGAVLLVTHDRFFLDRVSTELLAFPPASAVDRELQFFSSFDQWQAWHASLQREPKKKKPQKKNPSSSQTKASGLSKAQLMRKIEQAEEEYKKIEMECSQPEIAENVEALMKRGEMMTELQEKINQYYEQWTELES